MSPSTVQHKSTACQVCCRAAGWDAGGELQLLLGLLWGTARPACPPPSRAATAVASQAPCTPRQHHPCVRLPNPTLRRRRARARGLQRGAAERRAGRAARLHAGRLCCHRPRVEARGVGGRGSQPCGPHAAGLCHHRRAGADQPAGLPYAAPAARLPQVRPTAGRLAGGSVVGWVGGRASLWGVQAMPTGASSSCSLPLLSARLPQLLATWLPRCSLPRSSLAHPDPTLTQPHLIVPTQPPQ